MIQLADDGYPIVHVFPRIVHEHNRCSYPLHPTDNYHGEKSHRSNIRLSGGTLAPETPMIIVPHWQEFGPGEWRWCPRCARRNALRTRMVKRRYEASLHVSSRIKTQLYRGQKIKDWGHTWTRLGGRFVTQIAQTVFANQHAPEDMAWCPCGRHYVALEDMASRHTQNKAVRQCFWCYKRSIQFMAVKRNWRAKTRQAADLERLRTIMAQITTAQRELADLRRLKESVAQEIVTMQRHAGAPALPAHETTANYDILLNGEATTGDLSFPEQRAPRDRSRRDRRRAYST